jgi:hypothetical protein
MYVSRGRQRKKIMRGYDDLEEAEARIAGW